MTKRLVFSQQAAEYLGFEDDGYLLNQAKLGNVAYYQPSPKKIVFDLDDLDKWVSGWRRVNGQTVADAPVAP